MAHTEKSLSKLNKEDLIRLTLDFQQKHDNLFGKLMEDFADPRADYVKLEAERAVSDTFKNRIITLERKYWRNGQYPRRKCIEISGIPDGTPDSWLENKLRKVYDKIDSAVKSKNMEAYHWWDIVGG